MLSARGWRHGNAALRKCGRSRPTPRCLRGWAAMVLVPLLLAGCSGRPPEDLGVRNGRLAPCPPTPNCVSSMAEEQDHLVDPLTYLGSRQAAAAALARIVRGMPGASLSRVEPDYLLASFSSKVFGFVDDVEFYLPAEKKVIHIRSASRLGYYDFGVNAGRVARLRSLWDERGEPGEVGP